MLCEQRLTFRLIRRNAGRAADGGGATPAGVVRGLDDAAGAVAKHEHQVQRAAGCQVPQNQEVAQRQEQTGQSVHRGQTMQTGQSVHRGQT